MSRLPVIVRRSTTVSLLLGTLMLVACSSPVRRPVVVEDRPVGRGPASPVSPAAAPAVEVRPGAGTPAVAVPSGVASPAEVSPNAGKPGYYTVRPGDTLVRIGLDHGQNWRDIARWNQLENPNLIEVGQVLRVRPEALATRPLTKVPERPDRQPAGAPSGSPTGAVGGATAPASSPAGSAREPITETAAELQWAWPAGGPVLQGFEEQRNKGLDIGGKAGDPVLAAAEGRVVYAGSALRGYGNLVILKHNGTFLSAYAHNQTLLVKEDQMVKRGQKIAEMGSTDAERVQLHFEIRRDGKPVDPARYLPAR